MNTISREKLLELITNKAEYLLIDVRNRSEVELYGAIETALNIPLAELAAAFEIDTPEQLKKLGLVWNTKVPIIFYCRSGRRSEIARQIAVGYGYNALNYEGSILEWAQTDLRVKAY